MGDRAPSEWAPDRLGRDVPLPHRVVLPVLGLPVVFASNAAAVMDAVESAFGTWRILDRSPRLVEPRGALVRLVVHPGDEGGHERPPVRHRVMGSHRILFSTPGSVALAEPDRREAHASVTRALIENRAWFRHAILEALTLATLTPLDRQPLHAAALVRGDVGLVMAGPSGVGKSTLAYAAMRSGLRVLAEDTVYLQARPCLRVWGLGGQLRLTPDARERFAELADEPSLLLPNGKRKLVVDLRAADALPSLPVVERAVICLLERDGGPPGLDRIPPAAVMAGLRRGGEAGFDLFSDTIGEPLGPLAATGGWRLRLSGDTSDAVPRLHAMLDDLERASV